MANGKKSFVLYCDLVHSVEILNDEQAGKLFKHILNYVNDFDPKESDPFIRLAFEPIKQQLKRDLKTWRTKKKKRSDAGKKGMESRWKKGITKDNNVINDITKITVSANVNDTVNVNGNVIESSSPEVFYNAEELITKNQIKFETICMAASKNREAAVESLRKYHLYLEENEKYPRTKKSIFAGFEKWLRNEKNNTHGNSAIETSSRHKGAGILIAGLKQEYAARRKEDD